MGPGEIIRGCASILRHTLYTACHVICSKTQFSLKETKSKMNKCLSLKPKDQSWICNLYSFLRNCKKYIKSDLIKTFLDIVSVKMEHVIYPLILGRLVDSAPKKMSKTHREYWNHMSLQPSKRDSIMLLTLYLKSERYNKNLKKGTIIM